jgi:outer membrane lipoprotein SlyB
MRRLILALPLAAAALLALAGCQFQEPTVRGTVVAVTEIPVEGLEESARHYEQPLVPEVAWKVQVRLDNGRALTVTQGGERRYRPGERVRLLIDAENALLL